MFPNSSRQKSSKSEYWYKKVPGSFGQLYHYHITPVFQTVVMSSGEQPADRTIAQIDLSSFRKLLS